MELLTIARGGLRRQQRRDGRGLDETLYLEEMAEIAESGVTLAERLLGRWEGSRAQKVANLVDHCGYRE